MTSMPSDPLKQLLEDVKHRCICGHLKCDHFVGWFCGGAKGCPCEEYRHDAKEGGKW